VKIGLSYSRCVRDIYDGVVDINDVLIIISRTDFDPNNDEQWTSIWEGYSSGRSLMSNPEWMGYQGKEQEFRNISQHLYNEGKLHQPRKFGAHPRRRPEIWLEAVLPNSELDNNPAAKKAWDKFQNIAGLTNVELDDKYQ
jgi:hypothetical protein